MATPLLSRTHTNDSTTTTIKIEQQQQQSSSLIIVADTSTTTISSCQQQKQKLQKKHSSPIANHKERQRRVPSSFRTMKQQTLFLCFVLLLSLFYHLPVTTARYFRQPTSGFASVNAREGVDMDAATNNDEVEVEGDGNGNGEGEGDDGGGRNFGISNSGGNADNDFENARNPAALVEEAKETDDDDAEYDDDITDEEYAGFFTYFPTAELGPTDSPTFFPTMEHTSLPNNTLTSQEDEEEEGYLFGISKNDKNETTLIGDEEEIDDDLTGFEEEEDNLLAIEDTATESPTLDTPSSILTTALEGIAVTSAPTVSNTKMMDDEYGETTGAPTTIFESLIFKPATAAAENNSSGVMEYDFNNTNYYPDDEFNITTIIDDASISTGVDNDGEYPSPTPPTRAPVPTISTIPKYPVVGQVSLQLHGIPTPFYEGTRIIFLASAEEFVASSAVGKVADVRVHVIYQRVVVSAEQEQQNGGSNRLLLRRWLQQEDGNTVLQVDIGVEGLAFDENFSTEELDSWLYKLFEEEGRQFVTLLQEFSMAEGNPFFQPLTEVAALEPLSAFTTAPTESGLVPPLVIANGGTLQSDNDGNNDDSFPLIAIICAAVGGFIFIVVGILLVRFVLRYQRQKQPSSPASQDHSINFGNGGGSKNSATAGAAAGPQSITTPGNIQAKPSGESSVSSGSYLYTNSTANSQNLHYVSSNSRQLQETDTQSQMGGTTMGDNVSVMGDASYAYSLEPGIEPSLAGIPQSVAASVTSYSVIPGGGSASVASMTSGVSSFSFLKMPFGSKSSGSGGGAGSPSSNISGKPKTDVIAPAGKLGIVIDTTIDGPVVHKVNPGSALEGKIKTGDIIVAIDDVDTRAMTAAAITSLMVKTANQRRKLTIVSS